MYHKRSQYCTAIKFSIFSFQWIRKVLVFKFPLFNFHICENLEKWKAKSVHFWSKFEQWKAKREKCKVTSFNFSLFIFECSEKTLYTFWRSLITMGPSGSLREALKKPCGSPGALGHALRTLWKLWGGLWEPWGRVSTAPQEIPTRRSSWVAEPLSYLPRIR